MLDPALRPRLLRRPRRLGAGAGCSNARLDSGLPGAQSTFGFVSSSEAQRRLRCDVPFAS
jgi:hypothetical protein